MSAGTTTTSSAGLPSDRATSCSRSSERAARTSRLPAAASCWARQRPMPLDAPVIRIRRPARFRLMRQLRLGISANSFSFHPNWAERKSPMDAFGRQQRDSRTRLAETTVSFDRNGPTLRGAHAPTGREQKITYWPYFVCACFMNRRLDRRGNHAILPPPVFRKSTAEADHALFRALGGGGGPRDGGAGQRSVHPGPGATRRRQTHSYHGP